jgi:hypothetical protein
MGGHGEGGMGASIFVTTGASISPVLTEGDIELPHEAEKDE